jgi:2'-5' RNA ligase
MLKKCCTKGIFVLCGLLMLSSLAYAQTIDNSALSKEEFRPHQKTYGLVYRLPDEVVAELTTKIGKTLQEDLLRLNLKAEASTFNLPHVTVVHIHSANEQTPRKMLDALSGTKLPPVLKDVVLKNFYTTEAAKGAGRPWWLDLGIVKSGAAYDEMMSFNTRAVAALTPLRDGPLPRVTGSVYAKMGDAGKALVETVGVSGVNVIKDGKELRSYNPHNTLVYSMAQFTPELQASMNQVAEKFNKVLPNGITTTFKTVSIVELAFSGNVLREIYRFDLSDGSAVDVATGQPVK